MKPPYRVPSMAEIQAIPWNGLKVVSTFSGAGGSCLGYRMAGCRVVWASEFIPAAQAVYKLNHPNSILDTRDIREVKAAEILEATGLERGEIDIFDGSPPCSGFSTAGKGAKGWGAVKAYSDTKQRVDDLFFEYTRLLDGLQPKVFVAENVTGLVRGQGKGYFKIILQKMKDCGYKVSARVLDASWLGVPQARKRLIFVGVRNDLERAPVHPSPMGYQYTIRDALPWLGDGRVIHDTSGEQSQGDITEGPSPTVTVGVGSVNSLHFHVDGGGVPASDAHGCLDSRDLETPIRRWRSGPPPKECEGDAPSLEGCSIGPEWDKLRPGESSERYFNLVKPDPDKPCPTVTQEAGRHAGTAGVTHPIEKRKFAIVELKRISAFPDDFLLTGTYFKRWERLGRAVPPVMMCAIAAKIRDDIFDGGR